MEQRIITNKYKNIQYYESKYVSSKRHDTEFELINEKKYDYIIEHSANDNEIIDISNGSRNNEQANNKYNNININNKRNNNYKSYNPNTNEGNNINNDEYNNGGNISYNKNKNNQNNNYIINRGNNIINYTNNRNNNQILIDDSKKLSNAARALQYLGNKDNNNNINIKNNLKIDYSTEKIILTKDNKSTKNNNKRNFDMKMNYVNKKNNLVNPNLEHRKITNNIWSNINKDLVPTKADLKFHDNEDENNKSPIKINERYCRNYFTEKNIENNNNKINGGEKNIHQFLNEDDDKYDTEENNSKFISYRIRIKDTKELSKQKEEQITNLKKYKSNSNIKVTYDQGRRSNKNIKEVNAVDKNKNVNNQNKIISISNLAKLKNSANTRSSPNMLNDINHNKTNTQNPKTPKIIKDNSNVIISNSNNGKNNNRNNEENKSSPIPIKTTPLFQLNSNFSKNNKIEENPVRRIYIEKGKNNYKEIKNSKNISDTDNIDNNKMNEKIKELKKIMNYNYRIDNVNNENGIKIENNINNNNKENSNHKIVINKNPYLLQQNKDNNKIVFHKKVSKSPVGFSKKSDNTNDNSEIKYNFKPTIKITNRNFRNCNNNIIKISTENNTNFNSNDNKIKIKPQLKSTEKFLNKTNNNKKVPKNSYILKDSSISNGNSNIGTVYIRHTALKKVPIQNIISKNKIYNSSENTEIKVSKNIKFGNENDMVENIDNYLFDKIKEKIKLKNNRVIKYYDFYLKYPEISRCVFNNTFFKDIKYPNIDICHISKINSVLVLYALYKSKNNICYITKTRQIIKKLIKTPINGICEYSKNIILNPLKNDLNENKENKDINKQNEENKQNITTTKKNKKRKKRRKTKRIPKETNENNNNLTETKKENTDITSKDISKDEEINDNKISNININSNETENNNIISIPKKFLTNDKSSQEEKSAFSEKENLIESNSVKKKLSPTTYNDEEFNEEENDDFRIASDDDDLSEDKLKKKSNDNFEKFENGKTLGKEIIGDYESNKGNLKENDKNKIKYQEGLKLLEKINDKRIRKYFNENYDEYNDENDNDNENDNNYEDINEDIENNDENDNDNLNKNIILGANKLNLIFNNQKNYKFTSEEDNVNEYDNYDEIYTDSNININYSENEYNNNKIIINEKKNLTYKNNYEKIGSIFDKLEEIFDKKKEINNIDDINKDKYKTPILDKNIGHKKNRISDFNLKPEDYSYNSNNEDEALKKKKNTYNKKEINMNKYQDIFNNKQQIISKLELLMNKPKSKNNKDNLDIDLDILTSANNNYYNIFNYNSPKIESEIDSDMNINKDTPGNRKEILLYNLQSNSKTNPVYSLQEILSYKNKDICNDISLLPKNVLNHCETIIKTIKDEYSSFKVNYKEININYDKKLSMDKWARKDMTKEIEKAEKYVKELNMKMSKDAFKHEIIEILNTLTVDNYKNILNALFLLIFLEENDKEKNDINNNNMNISLKNYILNKPEYLLHNQFIFIEIILEKATKEKGYVILYAKLCADLFIEFIKYIKDINNPDIENQLLNGENLKTILTSECRQKFDECISMETLYKDQFKNKNEEEKKEIFLNFKKKFLGNIDFIAELINVKLLSQTKGFEFLDILFKRFCDIKNDQIKYLNLEGAIILLNKFGKIVFERKNPKHLQNLDNYLKDNIFPITEKKDINLPNYLKFKIINLIEKKKNNWKDSLYEQSIIAKGKNNNNISIYHDHSGIDNNINIDESLMDNSINNRNNNTINKSNVDMEEEKENNIIILIKNDLENYVTYLNEHQIYSLFDLNEKDNNNDINNNYDWSITDDLIIKEKTNLEEIIRCYIEVSIDYVQNEKNIFYCNEYIKNIINYYSVDLNKEQSDKVRKSMIDLFLNIENICIDNFLMFEIMGYLMLLLLENYLFSFEDLDQFINEDKNKIEKIVKVIKYTDNYYPEDKKKEFKENLEKIELFQNNKKLFN